MDYVTTVRVLVRETRRPIANARVELYDRDEKSDDDLLGSGITNRFGEVTFKYNSKAFTDGLIGADETRLGGDTVPDLYPVVYDAQGGLVVSKRGEATRNKASLHILVLVEQEKALAHKLLDDQQ